MKMSALGNEIKTYFVIVVLLLVSLACKPIAKQEPVTGTQWTPVIMKSLNKLMNALKTNNFKQSQMLLSDPNMRLSQIEEIIKAANAQGYSKQIKKLIENYRAPLPAADKIAKEIKQLQSNDDDSVIIALVKLRGLANTTRDNFKRWAALVKSSDLQYKYGTKIYSQQLKRVQSEFNNWAEPLWEQVDTEVQKLLQQLDSETLTYTTVSSDSRLDDMRTIDDILRESKALKQTLTTKF